MVDLSVQYGFYKEHLISITKKGMDGQQEIADMMEGYRNNPPSLINGIEVAKIYDYEIQEAKELASGKSWKLELPKSNVLQFVLSDGSVISARPSGTEPKIKFYFSVNAKLESAADYNRVDAQLDQRIKGIIADMNL